MKSLVFPHRIKIGDTVRVIAPSYRVAAEDLTAGLAILESWGLEVQLGKYVLEHWGPFAGEDSRRLFDLQSALDDPDIQIIWCARGGYGLSRLIGHLDWTKFRKHPKWVVGFSDTTFLHLALFEQGFPSIHGPGLKQLAQHEACHRELHSILFDRGSKITWRNKEETPADKSPSSALLDQVFRLIGGNLTCVHDWANQWPLQVAHLPNDLCLMIEEVGEEPYRIDRMLEGLRRIRGIHPHTDDWGETDYPLFAHVLAGDFSDREGNLLRHYPAKTFPETIPKLLKRRWPTTLGFPAGHRKVNMPFVHGGKYRLVEKTNGQCSLTWLAPSAELPFPS